jgi:hypothetical protein
LGRQDTGRLLLDADLTDALGNPLPAGTYNFTFFGIGETDPVPPNSSPEFSLATTLTRTGQKNVAALARLSSRLDRAENIDDPEQSRRVVERLRAWMKIVRRGIDLDSREGQLKRRLVNARSLSDPEQRRRTVDRIKTQLEKQD